MEDSMMTPSTLGAAFLLLFANGPTVPTPAQQEKDIEAIIKHFKGTVFRSPGLPGNDPILVVTFFEPAFGDDELNKIGPYLAGLKQLERLEFLHCKVSDHSLPALAPLKQLKTLKLRFTSITDAGLPQLAGLTQLEYLELRGNKITGAGLKHLQSLKKLNCLDLSDSTVSAAALQNLAGMHIPYLCLPVQAATAVGLKHFLAITQPSAQVDLWDWRLTDADLSELLKYPQIEELRLDKTPITDAGVPHLAKLKKLKKLWLNNTAISDLGLEPLMGMNLDVLRMPDLACTDLGLKYYLRAVAPGERLHLSHWDITDAGLKELSHWNDLNVLELTATKIGDGGLKHLAKLKKLTSLHLSGTNVTDAGLKALAGMNVELDLPERAKTDVGLKHYLAAKATTWWLKLEGWNISDVGIRELSACKNLKVLWLGRTAVTDAALDTIAGLATLEELGLENTLITDGGLERLAGLNLKELRIPQHAKTDVGLKHYLAAMAPPINCLKLKNWHITAASVETLTALKDLQVLEITKHQLGAQGVTQIKKALPKCCVSD
jgi:Leucine-rich repeat (LRR) protein